MLSIRSAVRVLLSVAAFGAAAPVAVQAQAGSYYLDAGNANNGIDIQLLTGKWTIGVSNGGWSPWNYDSSFDGAGANCHTGFHTVFYYTINGGPLTKYGWDGSERTVFNPNRVNDFYATPDLAFAHAFAPFEIDIATPTTLHLVIPDCCYWDNTGGLTIDVKNVTPSVVPEPSTVVLLAGGLAALVFVQRRSRRPAVDYRGH